MSQPTCPECGQQDTGQTGEQPCPICGLPTLHDDRVKPLENQFASAITTVRSMMRSDDSLSLTYQSNIAMRLWDNTRLGKRESNEAADQIMDLLFLNNLSEEGKGI